MAPPRNTETRRNQIVDGLLEVMHTHGYRGASVAAIARAAGLGSGLVHYHFGDKQEILLALIQRLEGALEGRYQECLREAGANPVAWLEAFIDAHLAMGEDADPRAVKAWVIIGAEAVSQPEVQALYAGTVARRLATLGPLVRWARETLEAMAEVEGEPGPADPMEPNEGDKARSAALLAAIEGYYQLSAAAPGSIPPGSAADAVRRYAHALCGP